MKKIIIVLALLSSFVQTVNAKGIGKFNDVLKSTMEENQDFVNNYNGKSSGMKVDILRVRVKPFVKIGVLDIVGLTVNPIDIELFFKSK